MIPNIIHFIFFNDNPFQLNHYLSVISAYKVHQPEIIYFYYSEDQENNLYWSWLKEIPIIELVKVEKPEKIKETPLTFYQQKTDYFKLVKMIEKGGIYLDLDILSLKSFQPLIKKINESGKKCALAMENDNNPDMDYQKLKGSISNSVIFAEPDNDYLKEWLDKLPDNILGKPWAYQAVCLPRDILNNNSEKYKKYVEIMQSKNIIPFTFEHDFIFHTSKNNRIDELNDVYTIHLWEGIWKDRLEKIDLRYLRREDNIITKLFNKYINEMTVNQTILDITRTYYFQQKYDEIINLELFELVHSKKYNPSIKISNSDIQILLFYYAFACQTKNTRFHHAIQIYQNMINSLDTPSEYREYAVANLKNINDAIIREKNKDTFDKITLEEEDNDLILEKFNGIHLEELIKNHLDIYVLNLEKRKDRWLRFVAEAYRNKFTYYERFNAVDGYRLQKTPELEDLIKNNTFMSRRGVLGHYLSNIKMWQSFKKDYLLILEDDVKFTDNFLEKLYFVLRRLIERKNDPEKDDIDFLYLGFTSPNKDYKYDNEETLKIYYLKSRLDIWGGTFSYIISKKFANQLLKGITDKGIIDPADTYILEHDVIHATLPHIVVADFLDHGMNIYDSDIQTNVQDMDDTYVFFPNKDSPGNDIQNYSHLGMKDIKTIADEDPNCVAFNTNGWLKSSLVDEKDFEDYLPEHRGVGLYVKKDYWINRNK